MTTSPAPAWSGWPKSSRPAPTPTAGTSPPNAAGPSPTSINTGASTSMRNSESIATMAPALVAALAQIEGAAKSAVNPHFRSRYANLETVVEASRPILAARGIAVLQGAGCMSEGHLTLTTRLLHISGEWIEDTFEIPLAKQDPQAALAALTYARRGALMAILGMPAVDDDGETAMGRPEPANGHSEPIQQRKLDVSPEGRDFWKCEGAGMSAYAAKKQGLDVLHERMREDIRNLHTDAQRREWIEENLADIQK